MKEVVYTPESELRHPARLATRMAQDLWRGRGLAWRLLLRNLSAQYRQTALGYLWAFLPPVVTAVTFLLLNRSNVFSSGRLSVPYPLFVIVGVLLWQTFLDALNAPLKLMESSKAMLAKINFPREAIIVAAVGEVCFNFLVRFVLIIGVLVFYQTLPGWQVLLFPLGVGILIMLGVTLGLLLTPVGVLFQDIGRAIALIGMFWMLLTPVGYLPEPGGLIARLNHWNPVSPVLMTTRGWLIGVPSIDAMGFGVVAVGVLIMLCAGWILFRVSLPHLIARIGN